MLLRLSQSESEFKYHILLALKIQNPVGIRILHALAIKIFLSMPYIHLLLFLLFHGFA
jgi:hypothetical protein